MKMGKIWYVNGGGVPLDPRLVNVCLNDDQIRERRGVFQQNDTASVEIKALTTSCIDNLNHMYIMYMY